MSAHRAAPPVWLNPPRHDDPLDDSIIELHPAEDDLDEALAKLPPT